MKAMRLFFALLLTAPLARVASAQPVLPVITNLVAVQRPGTFYVDVTYDLIDPDSPGGVYILAEASSDNGTNYGISMDSLSGDAGLVTPGPGKKLVWNAWNDWARNYTTNARVRLIADDFPEHDRLHQRRELHDQRAPLHELGLDSLRGLQHEWHLRLAYQRHLDGQV